MAWLRADGITSVSVVSSPPVGEMLPPVDELTGAQQGEAACSGPGRRWPARDSSRIELQHLQYAICCDLGDREEWGENNLTTQG